MALAPLYGTDGALGEFVEKETGNIFEYVAANDPFFGAEYPHKVMVGYDGEWRYGNVKKTVAHIVVDEDADGNAVVEKWYFKRHVVYKW